ncbi:MAG: DUF6498-containing protein [Usitatibacter sp.]
MTDTWPLALLRILVLFGLNLVPIWGFTQEQWTPGTTFVLYWLQSAFSIPITAVLVVMHRRATHKQGHYDATSMMSGGRLAVTSGTRRARSKGTGHGRAKRIHDAVAGSTPPVVTSSTRTTQTGRFTFLSGFLMISIPLLLVHGLFLFLMLGVVWKDAAGGVDVEDLRTGALAMLNMMAFGFAVDVFRLNERPFAWLRHRSETLMQRTLVVHMALILGMWVAAFAKNDAAAFFGVFLALKLVADLCSELPSWMPKDKPPRFFVWLYERFGDGKTDIYADWKQWGATMRANFENDERVVDPARCERS